MLKAGFAQIDITPRRQVSLAGYFNDRISKGVSDNLYARVVILEKDNVSLVIITLDLIGLPSEDMENVRMRLKKRFGIPAEHIIISCTHTHTAPATSTLFEVRKDKVFVKGIVPLIEEAVKRAMANKRTSEVYISKIREKGLSFNRRYIMKDGRVITNPPKNSPDIVKPEGPVDNLITTLEFVSKKKIIGLLINATNHVDTIGGNKISADWPGHLGRELNKKLKRRFPVMVLTGTAGNINHFDPANPKCQTSYKESQRIGNAYSRYVLKSLKKKTRLKTDSLSCISKKLTVPYRKVSRLEIKKTKELLKLPSSVSADNLTSEDLAQGNIAVKKLFARELLDFVKLYQSAAVFRLRKRDKINITLFRIGSLAIVGIPGEPFVEIGLAIKEIKYFSHIIVTGNTNGSSGYIPLKKHFAKGGYEVCTHSYNRFSEDLGERIIKTSFEMLIKIRRQS